MNKIAKNVAIVYIGDLINNENKIKQSNLKRPTSNSAITLIALIITIIALLILAGVTLNMIIGENGILLLQYLKIMIQLHCIMMEFLFKPKVHIPRAILI